MRHDPPERWAPAAASASWPSRGDYRVFFSPENPELVAFDGVQNTYTKNDNILFVIQPSEGEILESELVAALEWLTSEA